MNYFFHVCSALPVFSGNSRINYLLCLLSFQLYHWFLPSVSLSAHLPCIISPQSLHFKINSLSFSCPLSKAQYPNLLLLLGTDHHAPSDPNQKPSTPPYSTDYHILLVTFLPWFLYIAGACLIWNFIKSGLKTVTL